MRLALLTLVATVVLPGGVDAQEAVWCGRESGRTIRGHVADSAGLPVDSAVVQVVVRRAQNDYGGGRCEIAVGAGGSFEVAGVPTDSILMVMVLDFGARRAAGALLEASAADTSLTFTVGRGMPSIRDWTALADRPAALDDADKLEGCYWMGWPILGEERRFFVIGDSLAGPGRRPGEGTPRWRLLREGHSLHVTLYRGRPGDISAGGYQGLALDLSEPVDWAAIPTRFLSRTDNGRFPNDVRSFVTRVPCAGNG